MPVIPNAAGGRWGSTSGRSRLYAGRVDIRATIASLQALAEAGPDRVATVTALPAWLLWMGASDPSSAAAYHNQISGPAAASVIQARRGHRSMRFNSYVLVDRK
jgi:hypothetical protein